MSSAPHDSALRDRVLFGAAYYHEYQPSPRLDEDMRLMQEAGFSVIRVGESVWSTWEPRDGVFDLEWLAPVLDAAHEHGIRVILGTPTYAAPMWLVRQVPEINAERRTGHRIGWGARQEINYAHPAFLFHAERVIRKIIGRYAQHPAVIGYQVDNEPGNEVFANDQVFQRFVDHLRERYGSVEELNREWGLTYWSHRLSDWADLWRPDLNVQPQYTLAWRRFQADLTTAFIGWQAEVVREYAREDQFVTTCISYDRPTLDEEAVARDLDVAAGNPYYRMQDSLALPRTREDAQFWTTTGTWSLFAHADRMYGTKQAPFLVTETNAQAIGMPWMNEPAFDGQWRQAAWALISRGASMIEYWHWHTLHTGAETYWGGILPHSQQPGRVYRELAALGAELREAGPAVAGLTPHADVALLFDNASKWVLHHYPALAEPGTVDGDPRSFQTVYEAYARGAFEAGLQSGAVHIAQLRRETPGQFAARRPVLVAASFTIASDADLQWLREYAEAGGHLILGIRTGYEDEEARARLERKPALLDRAAGVWYDEFSNLREPLPVVAGADAESAGFTVPGGARATLWADGLQRADDGPAQVLVGYDHPHYGRWPAVTTRVAGAGRVTYIGTVPDAPLAAALLDWAVAVGAGTPSWRPVAESQTISSSTNRAGERVHVIHNWAWRPSVLPLPSAARDVVTGERLEAGAELALGAWDVRVVAESV
ncbi:beta-galactosidase [Brachybacterium hainanense]|uniref:beta-galactosidase n=1 Tax=Brachybacterium hainanense TaxID=1541174 RepID=A0ABV6R8D7_9MICO